MECKKKLLSLLLSVAVVFGTMVAPVNLVFAGTDVVQEGESIDNEAGTYRSYDASYEFTWDLDEKGMLTVFKPADGGVVYSNWIREMMTQIALNDIKKIVFEEGITVVRWDRQQKPLTAVQELVLPSSIEIVNDMNFKNGSLKNVTGGQNIRQFNCIINGTPYAEKGVIFGKKLFSYSGSAEKYIIPEGVEEIEAYAFELSENLQEVEIQGNVKEIPFEAFGQCKTLKTLTLPKSVVEIGYGAFDNCSSLESIQIPNSVEKIGMGAFMGCENLKTLLIPKTVTSIGDKAYGYFCEDWVNTYKYDGTTIQGERGTQAESYAKQNDIRFVNIGKTLISQATVSIEPQTYTGKALTPAITVKIDGTTLKKDTDYTVTYKNNTSVGNATVMITGIGKYTGTKTTTFKINAKSINGMGAVLSYTNTTYSGSAKKPTVMLKDEAGKTLKSGTDYNVAYSNNTNVGRAKVTITGKGNYTGTITTYFTISANPSLAVVAATNLDGKPRLTWDKVAGAEKYAIYRSGYSNGTYKKMYTTTSTSYTNTSAGAGYTYFYRVEAMDKSGKIIAESGVIKQKCEAIIPSVVTVKGGNSDAGKPKLTWGKVVGAEKYTIYRSGYSNGTYKKMYTTTSTGYINTSAGAGYTYFYKVEALDKNGKIIAKSAAVKQICKLEKPVVAKGNSGIGKPMLTWKSVPGAVKYEIYRSGYSNGTYKKMYTTTGTSYTNTSAGTGYTYFYKIVAVSKNNQNANATSQIVKQKCLAKGLEVIKSNAVNGKPKLTWKKVDGATKYEIYRSGYSNGTYKKMYTTTASSYTNTSATKGYTYFYKVKAISPNNFVESNIVSVKCK